MSVPDYPLGETLDFKFTTRAFATGVPTTLAGTPVVEVYEDNSLTQITAGETLTVDFDSVTGLNNLRIVATGANGYEAGKSYAAIISAGTVGGVSVVGEVVAQFSIERSPALRPTTAGRTLDVTATGAAGIDWGNIENPTTVVDLSGTDINLVDTTTTNTDMRGTDNAALASVLGALADAAAAGDPTASDTVVAYVKQLVNTLEGTAGIPTFPASAVPGDAVSMVEVLRQVYDEVAGLDGAAMRGTDSALLAASAPTNFGDMAITATTGEVSVDTLTTDVISAASLSAAAAQKIRDEILPTQNVAFSNLVFLFVDSTDHVTPVTAASGTAVTRSIDGGAFVAGTGTLAEVANGIYQYDASAADMNGGVITFRFTATGGTPNAPDDRFVTVITGGGV